MGKTCFPNAVLQATFLFPWWVAMGLIAICRTKLHLLKSYLFVLILCPALRHLVTYIWTHLTLSSSNGFRILLRYIFKHCARPCGRCCSSVCPRLSAFVLVQSSGEQRQAEPVDSAQHHRLAVDLRGQATTLLLLERCRPKGPCDWSRLAVGYRVAEWEDLNPLRIPQLIVAEIGASEWRTDRCGDSPWCMRFVCALIAPPRWASPLRPGCRGATYLFFLQLLLHLRDSMLDILSSLSSQKTLFLCSFLKQSLVP